MKIIIFFFWSKIIYINNIDNKILDIKLKKIMWFIKKKNELNYNDNKDDHQVITVGSFLPVNSLMLDNCNP